MTGYPIPPVVAYYTDPSYRLSKYLAWWFRETANFTSKRSILNSTTLAHELDDRVFPLGSRLVSFDAVSMFTRIPVQYTIDLVVNNLCNRQLPQNIIDEFKTLIQLCLKDNTYKFQNKTYQFPDGLPMGGSLSTLLADVFMSHMEYTILEDPSAAQSILHYGRYVD